VIADGDIDLVLAIVARLDNDVSPDGRPRGSPRAAARSRPARNGDPPAGPEAAGYLPAK
jgi:hypothetical protein